MFVFKVVIEIEKVFGSMKERHKYDASNFEYLDEVAQSFYA
ncbi:MAG: hypothetical protein SPL64_03960 [Bacteroidaceae bacterium]|nr:hypothetical protein [Bacteroidaceae bacterium]